MDAVSRIVTSHVFPPIPVRQFDWCAWIDGDEEGLRGTGSTEQEAIDDLMAQQMEFDETRFEQPTQDDY